MSNEDDINKIVAEINNCISEINSILNQQNKESESDSSIKEYFLINKTWLEKYFSITKKENIFKDLIYSILKKIPLSPPQHIYQYNQNNYKYFNNLKIIPKHILPHFLSIKNDDNNNNQKYVANKIIFKYSKIIIILEEDMSLEILNKNIIPEYLLCLDKNKNKDINNINIQKMIDICVDDMELNMPDETKINNVYDFETRDGIIITIVNLEKILEEEKIEKNEISKKNCNEMNQLWENKYKKKMNKYFDEIVNKYNENFRKQINLKNEIFSENIKNQYKEQNKIFNNNYNNIINKIYINIYN